MANESDPSTTANPNDGSDIDEAAFSQLEVLGADVVQQLAADYLAEGDRLIAALAAAIAAGDAAGVKRATHDLRSTSGAFGLRHVVAIASELERHAKAGAIDPMPALLVRLKVACARGFAEVRARVAALT